MPWTALPLAALLLLSVAAPAAHAGSKAPEYKVEDKEDEYKVEYKDGRCEYKYELKYDTGKEKVEQKGDCRGIAPPRRGRPPAQEYWMPPR